MDLSNRVLLTFAAACARRSDWATELGFCGHTVSYFGVLYWACLIIPPLALWGAMSRLSLRWHVGAGVGLLFLIALPFSRMPVWLLAGAAAVSGIYVVAGLVVLGLRTVPRR